MRTNQLRKGWYTYCTGHRCLAVSPRYPRAIDPMSAEGLVGLFKWELNPAAFRSGLSGGSHLRAYRRARVLSMMAKRYNNQSYVMLAGPNGILP